LIKTANQEISWKAYLDLKDASADSVKYDEISPVYKNSFIAKFE
jgi:hypothetical protein